MLLQQGLELCSFKLPESNNDRIFTTLWSGVHDVERIWNTLEVFIDCDDEILISLSIPGHGKSIFYFGNRGILLFNGRGRLTWGFKFTIDKYIVPILEFSLFYSIYLDRAFQSYDDICWERVGISLL